MREQTVTRETPSSVEITKTTRGYTWSIKCYAAVGEEQDALMRAREIDSRLSNLYAGREAQP